MDKIIESESKELCPVKNTVKELFESFDAKDWEKCRSLLSDVVELNIILPKGGRMAKFFADDLIDKWKTTLHKNRKTYRQFSDTTVELNNEKASVSSKSYIFHRLENCDEEDFWEIWGDYTHHLVKTENGWKCSGIRLAIPSQSANFDVYQFVPEREVKN